MAGTPGGGVPRCPPVNVISKCRARLIDTLGPRNQNTRLVFAEGYPSGQREQTVNLPAYAFEGSNPSPSTNRGSWARFRRKQAGFLGLRTARAGVVQW